MAYVFNVFTGTLDVVNKPDVLRLLASQPINAYKVVTTNSDGLAVYASTAVAAHVDQVVGVALQSTPAGVEFDVTDNGFVTNIGWSWVAGQPLFLGVDGEITSNPYTGVFTIQIGYAKTPTEIFVRIGRGILRAL